MSQAVKRERLTDTQLGLPKLPARKNISVKNVKPMSLKSFKGARIHGE